MASSIPRILAVDPTNHIGMIVRGAMTMLDRRFILVEVPSGEDALREIQSSSIQVIVTAYSLPDQTGIELAARAIRESASTSVIVLANASDPEVNPSTLANVPYTYLIRPVGEPLLRALRVGLGETVAAEASSANGAGMLDLGPIPDVDGKMLHDYLMTIMRETVSMGGFVADRLGRVVHSEGMTGYFDINACAAVLAPHFASTVQMRDFVSGNAWSLQYFDGDQYDLFAMSLGLHYFIVLIFDGTKRAAFGPVTGFGRRGVDSMIEELGTDAWSYRRQAPTRKTQTIAVPKVTLPEVADTPIETIPDTQPTEPMVIQPAEELKLEPVKDLDVDKLFGQKVDEGSFEDMFSEDDLSQASSMFSGGNSVSFDEAMDMGILDQ